MTFSTSVQKIIGVFLVLGVSGCDNDNVAPVSDVVNSSFNVWCGDNPCAWTVEEGDVEPVPTWHRSATGIRFASDPTRISQVIRTQYLSCVLLALQGDISGDAVLHFQVDTCNDGLDDGDVDLELPDGNWKTVYREARLVPRCEEARIILEKTGAGDAMLASAKLTQDSFCAENPPPSALSVDGGIDTEAH